jgi:cold shock CspA family protein
MVGVIKFWDSDKNFGFVITEDGQEFYLGAAAKRIAQRYGFRFLEGTRIRFDSAKKSDDAWTRRLNDGKLRDADGIDSRNPRPPRRPRVKPIATNVVVIDSDDPGGRS